MTTATGDTPPPAPKLTLFQEFRAFLDKYGVVGLAIAFVIGAALTALVTAIVNDLLMPIVGLILPAGGWQSAVFYFPALPAGVDPHAKDFVLPPHTLALAWGPLLGAAINFLIIAAFVFLVAKFVLRQKEIGKM
jgi:large conductance mechanosensitive channel